MKKLFLVSALLIFHTNISQNITGVENFLLASEEDKNLLVNNYFSPLFKSLQVSMNEGWSRSAKTHKKFGFDITFLLPQLRFLTQRKALRLLDLTTLLQVQILAQQFLVKKPAKVLV